MNKYFGSWEEIGKIENLMFEHKYDDDTDMWVRSGISSIGVLVAILIYAVIILLLFI